MIIGHGIERKGLYYMDDVAFGHVNQVQGYNDHKLENIWLWHYQLQNSKNSSQHKKQNVVTRSLAEAKYIGMVPWAIWTFVAKDLAHRNRLLTKGANAIVWWQSSN